MGEYAQFKGDRIKIGTCEDMYYLRFEDAAKVLARRGNVDPVRDAAGLRFRFPWPDEDNIPPGDGRYHANGYQRGLAIHGLTAPDGVEHGSIQFTASAGYLVSLPCPESPVYEDAAHAGGRLLRWSGDTAAEMIRVHRNGFPGAVQLVAQKHVSAIGLVPILRCGGCGAMWREEERERIEALAVCLRSEGDRQPGDARRWHVIADRVLAGIAVEAPA